MKLKKGVLIVIEGIDGAGKTTQAKRLLDTLLDKGLKAVYFREPSDSRWGRIIKEKAVTADSLSPEEELDLFQKDRRENVERNIKPALEDKQAVILDRYYFSTMAYQGARGIDPGWIQEKNEELAVIPDLVFILDVEPGTGLKRIEDRKRKDELFEQEERLTRVRKIFKGIQGDNIFHIDGTQLEDDISQDIGRIVLEYLSPLVD
jgi:dTMP kinase